MKLLLLALLPFTVLAAAPPPKVTFVDSPELQVLPTMTFTAKPWKGAAPLEVTLTWSATNAFGCVASGNHWSGNKEAGGTEKVTIVHSGKFILTCHGRTPDAVVSWTIPTTNTDGSPLTNLAGFLLYIAQGSDDINSKTPIKIPNPTTTTYTVSDLPAGINNFAMKSYNTLNAESSMTGSVQYDIPAQAAAISRWVTITAPPPPPPTDIKVEPRADTVPPPPPGSESEHPPHEETTP